MDTLRITVALNGAAMLDFELDGDKLFIVGPRDGGRHFVSFPLRETDDELPNPRPREGYEIVARRTGVPFFFFDPLAASAAGVGCEDPDGADVVTAADILDQLAPHAKRPPRIVTLPNGARIEIPAGHVATYIPPPGQGEPERYGDVEIFPPGPVPDGPASPVPPGEPGDYWCSQCAYVWTWRTPLTRPNPTCPRCDREHSCARVGPPSDPPKQWGRVPSKFVRDNAVGLIQLALHPDAGGPYFMPPTAEAEADIPGAADDDDAAAAALAAAAINAALPPPYRAHVAGKLSPRELAELLNPVSEKQRAAAEEFALSLTDPADEVTRAKIRKLFEIPGSLGGVPAPAQNAGNSNAGGDAGKGSSDGQSERTEGGSGDGAGA